MMWTAGKCFSDGTNILSAHSNNTQKRTAPQTVAVINTCLSTSLVNNILPKSLNYITSNNYSPKQTFCDLRQ